MYYIQMYVYQIEKSAVKNLLTSLTKIALHTTALHKSDAIVIRFNCCFSLKKTR